MWVTHVTIRARSATVIDPQRTRLTWQCLGNSPKVMGHNPQPRRRRGLVVAFSISAVLLLGSWVVLESSPKPCNADDFTGCSTLGEVAVVGFLVLIPITIGLALILVLNWVADQLRGR